MKHLMIEFFAACALTAVAANEYYVDAVNGVDDEAHDGSSWTKAKRTLSVACALATEEGDTVYVAEGDYKTGSTGSTYLYRAELAPGTKLVGVGDKNKIRIFGSATGSSASVGTNPMRCLRVSSGALVKHVTLCNGRASSSNGGCAYIGSIDTYIVDCVVSNNYTGGRGGAFAGGTFIRCLFTKNSSDNTGKCIYGSGNTEAWNCVFNQVGAAEDSAKQYVTHYTKTYNCTFTGGGASGRGGSHYNDLNRVVDGGGADSDKTYIYSCVFSGSNSRSKYGEGSLTNVGAANVMIDENFVPVKGSNKGIDYGKNSYYEENFPDSELVADQKYLDFNGNPRILGAAIDAGACESDPDERMLTISDEQTALVVAGAAKGETVLRYGETNTFTLARNYSTQKLCTGVRVNGEFFSFTGETADMTYEHTYGYGDPVTNLVIEAVYAEHNDWFVDANSGDNANNGYTRYQAKKTLVGAVTNELVASGDIIHAAEGLYNQDEMGTAGSTSNRVRLAAGVGLVADGSVAGTIIEGVPAKDLDKSNPAGVRCVSMGEGAYVKGFTLRNGSTAIEGTSTKCYDGKGGGVSGGTAIDCIITNCTAVRGGGANSARLIRCRVVKCSCESGTNPYGIEASKSGASTYSCSLYDSYVDDECAEVGKIVNSILLGDVRNTSGAFAYNSYLDNVRNNTFALSNCFYRAAVSGCDVETSTKVASVPALDAALRPAARDSILVDAGKSEYYVYPAGFEHEAGKDLTGGQRIYNAVIDVGCGEFDWRDTYSKALKSRRVSVAEASSQVTNTLNAVVVGSGGKLVLEFVINVKGMCSIDVTGDGEGSVRVTSRGESAEVVDNTYFFAGEVGSNTVEIEYTGSGAAKVCNPKYPMQGLRIHVR